MLEECTSLKKEVAQFLDDIRHFRLFILRSH